MLKKLFLLFFTSIFFISCDSKPDKIIRPVEVFEVSKSSDTISYSYPAIISSEKETSLSFKIPGEIYSSDINVGTFVKENEIIASLDKRDYLINLEATSKKTLTAENVYKASKAISTNAKSQFARALKLYKEKAMAKKAFEEAFAMKEAAVSSELANLAQYEMAKQGLLNAQNKLLDTDLKAPFDGYITRKFFDKGGVVSAGLPVFTISSLENNKITINVSEKDLDNLKNLSHSELIYDDIKYSLSLVSASKIKGMGNATYPVTFKFQNDVKNIPSDSEGEVKLYYSNTVKDSIIIPIEAIFEKNNETKVWVYENDIVTEKNIKILKPYSDGMVIVSGLNQGDKIVTKGVHELIQGQKVKTLKPYSNTNIGEML